MPLESDYLVRNPRLVLEYFQELISKKCLITAHFGELNTGFLTTIVDLNKEKRQLSLDCAPSEKLDQQLLSSSKVLFRTEINGIKVSFSGKDIKKTKLGDEPVFTFPIPDSIFWMQRRQYYRVKIPLSHTGSYCRLNLLAEDKLETVTFRLHDLSLKGFSFMNPDPRWSEFLKPDTMIEECTLHLQSGSHAGIGFTIKDVNKVQVNTITVQDRVGCALHPVSPAFETSIQRYMQEIELQQKNIG